jgi:hypothetical protein
VTIPTTNPTRPSVPTLSIAHTINGTISFELAEPVVRPLGTRYQIIRSTVSTNADVGTVVFDGDTRRVDLVCPASNHWYFGRAHANSLFSAYSPNTLGLLAAASGFNAGQIAPSAVTYVTMANCGATQTFSKGGIAFYASEMGRVTFPPQDDDAEVIVTATFRAGIGNFHTTNRIGLQFVTGVTSSYLGPVLFPNGGSTTDLRPSTLQAVFPYSRTNSAYALLYWDAASGPNSVVIDQVSLAGEFIKR